MGVFWGDSPVPHGPAGCRLLAMPRKQLGLGTCGGERDADPCRGLGDAPSDLDQPNAQGGELGVWRGGCGLGMASRTLSISQ